MSYLYINNKKHTFRVDEKDHPASAQVKELARAMLSEIEHKGGHVPDTRWVLADISEEEKRQKLCVHSERLAIAYGVLHSPPGSELTIYNNLRMCGDCHNAVKLLAPHLQRLIRVRDANRWHEFKDGRCSCNDYF